MAASSSSRLKIGIFLLIFGGSCNAVGIGLAVAPKRDNDVGAGIFWMCFSLLAVMLPGLLLVLAARKQALRTKRLDTIAALATASERLAFDQLATDLGVDAKTARELLLEAIGAGRIVGRLDVEHGVFVSGSTRASGVQQLTMTCKGCGGRSTVVVTAHSQSLCPYCGFRMA
jgi:hypothetical protein